MGSPLWREVEPLVFSSLLGIASTAFLRSESHGTHEHILLPRFLRLLQPGGPGSCIYFPQEQGYTLYGVQVQVMLRPTVSRPVPRGVEFPLGPMNRF
jgi:hypothetical protein